MLGFVVDDFGHFGWLGGGSDGAFGEEEEEKVVLCVYVVGVDMEGLQ